MGELRRQLEYKCRWAGVPFREVAAEFPPSELRSHCGWRYEGLPLWRVYCGARATGYGLRHGRDVNAAVNIKDCGEWPGATGL